MRNVEGVLTCRYVYVTLLVKNPERSKTFYTYTYTYTYTLYLIPYTLYL